MFIAEVSSNHNRDLNRCIKIIEAAKECGFDAIKFQIFKIDELFTPNILKQYAHIAQRKEWEFPLDFLPHIREHCNKIDLKLGVTPFYIDAVRICDPYVDFFKVASYELMWDQLHLEISRSGKPVIISSGMATLEELQRAQSNYKQGPLFEQPSFLHCVSAYPANPENVNLGAIETMRLNLKTPIGWSDHTCDEDVILCAKLKYEAEIFELHFDLDGEGKEAVVGHCWLPKKARRVIDRCNKIELYFGDGRKTPNIEEQNERLWRADPTDGLRPTLEARQKRLIPLN